MTTAVEVIDDKELVQSVFWDLLRVSDLARK